MTDNVEGLSSILETLLEYRMNGLVIAVTCRGREIQYDRDRTVNESRDRRSENDDILYEKTCLKSNFVLC